MVNKDNLRAATEAMRSEKYPQTKGYLRDHVGYCGLGVISDVSGVGQWQRGGTAHTEVDWYDYVAENGTRSVGGLVPAVAEWLGLEEGHDDLDLKDEDGFHAGVADLNDQGYDLHRIAALIEKRYEL